MKFGTVHSYLALHCNCTITAYFYLLLNFALLKSYSHVLHKALEHCLAVERCYTSVSYLIAFVSLTNTAFRACEQNGRKENALLSLRPCIIPKLLPYGEEA